MFKKKKRLVEIRIDDRLYGVMEGSELLSEDMILTKYDKLGYLFIRESERKPVYFSSTVDKWVFKRCQKHIAMSSGIEWLDGLTNIKETCAELGIHEWDYYHLFCEYYCT